MKIIITTFTLLTVLSISLGGCTTIENGLFNMALGVERSMAGFDEHEIQLSDHKWVYLEAGEPGQPVVVLLHGFAAEKDNWTRMVKNLEGYHVIAPDLPGHGESSFNQDLLYGFDVQSLRLAKFIDALQLKNINLVGNSMGGAIAALYAYRHPENVRSLALIDAVGFFGDNPSELEQLLEEGKEPNPLIVRKPEDFERLMNFAMSQQPFLPWPGPSVLGRKAVARVDAHDKIFKNIRAEVEAARYSGGFAHIFQQLPMPTYVLWGEEDRVLDVSSVDKFFENIPDVTTEILPGVGHAPMVEVPSKTAHLLETFWHDAAEKNQIAIGK